MSARLAILAVVCLEAAAFADDETYSPPDFMSALPPLPTSIDTARAWRLPLDEALRIAMRENLNILLERESVRSAQLGITVADGEFEPLLATSYDHTSSQTPPLTFQAGTAGEILSLKEDDWNLSLSQRLSTGMQLQVGFTNSRVSTTAGTAVEPLNVRSQVALSVTQPLLHGFSFDRVIPRIDVLKAQIASERERQQLAIAAADVVERTEDAYWDVVAALYRYDLEVRSQKRADEQMALTKRQIGAGLLPPSDLIAAESTLAQRQLQVVQAEAGIDQAWDQLRAVLHLPRDQWMRPILPVDLPGFQPHSAGAEDALALALAHRPEVAQLQLDIDAEVMAVRKAVNDELPEVDLGVTAALVGQDSTYHGALAEIGRADASQYTVMLNMTWTPLRRATAAAAAIERSRERMAEVRRDQAVQDIWLAVRDAVRTQASAAKQVFAAAKFRELSTENLDVEQRKFLTGNSSNFIVAQRQEELASAQLAELTAVLGHKKATAALLHATGQLLDERHIVLTARK